MVSVGGLDLGGMWGNSISSIGKISTTFFLGFGALIAVGVIVFFIWKWWKNLTFYKNPISLTILMDNGMEKTRHDLRGGVFINRGIRDFKVKIPKQRKPHILGYIPDFGKTISTDGRLHFITSGDRTIWQQYEQSWKLKGKKVNDDGTEFEYDLISTPVSRETKQLTVNASKNWRETVDKQKLTAFTIAFGAFIIMAIAHLISLFIQARLRCGTT